MFQFYERVPKRDCDFYEKITQLRLNLNQSYIDLCKYHFPTEVALLRRNRGKIGQSLEHGGAPNFGISVDISDDGKVVAIAGAREVHQNIDFPVNDECIAIGFCVLLFATDLKGNGDVVGD